MEVDLSKLRVLKKKVSMVPTTLRPAKQPAERPTLFLDMMLQHWFQADMLSYMLYRLYYTSWTSKKRFQGTYRP